VALGEFIDDAADYEVLDHGAVAVDKHQRVTLSLLEVVQAHAIHGHELADGRIALLGLTGL
jgi:hypothetical protein